MHIIGDCCMYDFSMVGLLLKGVIANHQTYIYVFKYANIDLTANHILGNNLMDPYPQSQ